jgi:hypothetical protein
LDTGFLSRHGVFSETRFRSQKPGFQTASYGGVVVDALWDDLAGDEQSATRAVLALSARPREAVQLLAARLRPLQLEREQAERWLADLASPDAAVWRPVVDVMLYFDPRLAVGLKELMTDVTDADARRRLVAALQGHGDPDHYADRTIELRGFLDEDDGYNFAVIEPSGARYTTWAEYRVERICHHSWVRAVRAVVLLEHIGTPDAVAVLRDMATGHPDALPTKAAQDALARLDK